MSESIPDRIRRALASEGLEAKFITDGDCIRGISTVVISEKRRDRGREVAERIFSRRNRDVFTIGCFNFSITGNVDASDHAQIEKNIAREINASNAELIREVLAVLDKYGYGCDRDALRAAIAALSPETP